MTRSWSTWPGKRRWRTATGWGETTLTSTRGSVRLWTRTTLTPASTVATSTPTGTTQVTQAESGGGWWFIGVVGGPADGKSQEPMVGFNKWNDTSCSHALHRHTFLAVLFLIKRILPTNRCVIFHYWTFVRRWETVTELCLLCPPLTWPSDLEFLEELGRSYM